MITIHADYRASYRKVAAEDAWGLMQAWFKKYLMQAWFKKYNVLS